MSAVSHALMIPNLIELLFMKPYFAFSDNIDYVFLMQVEACYGMQEGQQITNILPKKSFSQLFVPYFYFFVDLKRIRLHF